MPLHPFHRRLLAEHLVRARRADDRERYAASQRQARVDANPHQIDAVLFALRRVPEGGCILADEVGLGKTIEAGLVIAQLRAEGAERVLLVVPKPLLGQWQAELAALFGLQAREEHHDFAQPGIYLIGRERAGSEAGARALSGAPPFDLVVIDEAHEIFSGLHRRFDADGALDDDSPYATLAARVKDAIGPAPVLLLTATPLQNSLAELWSLVHFVEPTGTLLGDLPTFRAVFCRDDDRTLATGQEAELQRRLATVVQRTLRRQAQPFLERPFTERRCRLYEYTMSPDERALYDDVTAYLLEPTLYAFRGTQRRLLLIGFHRRMASSIAALAASLDKVAERLADLLAGKAPAAAVELDLDDDDPDEAPPDDAPPPDPDAVRAELARVRDLARRARGLPSDAKARAFLDAVRLIRARGSGKLVVFTESITTQEYLRDLLVRDGASEDDITLFRGTNEGPRARAALARWEAEVGAHLAPNARPTRDIAVRLALVHEFRTRSSILVSTEAGAKGLNLQFCETVVNFDLPWNPQRIEQRIGRCHRYRQEHDVTVVNFVGKDNDAARLTFDILSQKLDLFGTVLDASDHVLYEPRPTETELVAGALSQDIERDLQDIYARSRTLDERTREMEALRDRVAERREAYERELRRTAQIIEARFDEQLRSVFRRFQEEIPPALAQLDADIAHLVEGHLADRGVRYTRVDRDGRARFELPDGAVATGDARGLADAQALNLSHPLVQDALASARAYDRGSVHLLAAEGGLTGELRVVRVDYGGFEPVQRLVHAAVLTDGRALPPEAVEALLRAEARDAPVDVAVDEDALAEALDEAAFADQREIEVAEQRHFERALSQLERYVEDKIFVLGRQRRALSRQLREARERRDDIVGADARRALDQKIAALEERDQRLESRVESLHSRQDEAYRRWLDHHRAKRYQPPARTEVLRLRFRTVTSW